MEKTWAGSLWKNSVLENWQWKSCAGKLEKVGISKKSLVGKLCGKVFQLENLLKPYGILYHEYPLSRLTKLPAVNASATYS